MPVKTLKNFSLLRRRALRHWLQASHRSRKRGSNDDVVGALECQWQGRAGDNKHISFFCGVGEWANHVSDALLDPSCDLFLLPVRSKHERRLFRYYARLMMAVAEILNDFEDVLTNAMTKPSVAAFPEKLRAAVKAPTIRLDIESKKKIRKLLGDDVDHFHDFVNKVIKHKANNLHLSDHHLPIRFDDCHARSDNIEIRMGHAKPNGEVKAVRIPKLVWIVDVLITAYKAFDALIVEDPLFQAICKPYERTDEMAATE